MQCADATPLCNFAHFAKVNEATGFSEDDPGCRAALYFGRPWSKRPRYASHRGNGHAGFPRQAEGSNPEPVGCAVECGGGSQQGLK